MLSFCKCVAETGLAGRLRSSRSRCASGQRHYLDLGRETFLDQDFRSLVKALPALRLAAERTVNGVDITGAGKRGLAQVAFTDGIADADVQATPLDDDSLQM